MLIGGIAQNANPLVQFVNAFGVGAAPGLPLIIIGAIVIVVGLVLLIVGLKKKKNG